VSFTVGSSTIFGGMVLIGLVVSVVFVSSMVSNCIWCAIAVCVVGGCFVAVFMMVSRSSGVVTVLVMVGRSSGVVGGISTGFVVYHSPSWCLVISMDANMWPWLFSKFIDPVPFLLPTWLNVCTSGLSIMYLSGDRIVPVESGVCNIVQYMTVLSFDIVLHCPTPIASHALSAPSSLLYVIIGIGVARVR